MKRSQRLAAIAVATTSLVSTNLVPIVVRAADSSGPPEEVVTTAARMRQSADEVIASYSVIDRPEIEARVVQSTQDLLRGTTGVDVVNTGGLGKLSSLFVRGTDAEQVLVMVDGARVGSATAGTTPFEFIPVDQIERIEIVRGPRSSLYGPDAIGGVIQIFTRQATDPVVRMGGGSHDTYEATAAFGTSGERGWFSISGNRIQSEGYNACNGEPFVFGVSNGGGCFTIEPDDDGFDNTSGALRGGLRIGERATLAASALYATGTTEFDGSFTNETDFRESVLTLSANVEPLDGWNLALVLGDSRDEQDGFFDDPQGAAGRTRENEFDTEKRHASLQSDVALGERYTLTFGADYVDDRVDSSTQYDATERDNLGVFGQLAVRVGAHHVLAAARRDDNEQFGTYDTGSVGWKWDVSEAVSFSAAAGKAFGTPTFNDLYFPNFSNPNLDPENSRSVEVGANGRFAATRWSLAAYENQVDDLIVFDSVTFTPVNLNKARVRGIEAQATASLADWTLDLGYAWLDPRNRSPGANFDNYLPRRARHQGHVEVGRDLGDFAARARLTMAGSRYDNIANSNHLGGYATLDLVADYAVTPQWTVQGKIGNAFDREYETARFYNQEGRTFFVNVIFKP